MNNLIIIFNTISCALNKRMKQTWYWQTLNWYYSDKWRNETLICTKINNISMELQWDYSVMSLPWWRWWWCTVIFTPSCWQFKTLNDVAMHVDSRICSTACQKKICTRITLLIRFQSCPGKQGAPCSVTTLMPDCSVAPEVGIMFFLSPSSRKNLIARNNLNNLNCVSWLSVLLQDPSLNPHLHTTSQFPLNSFKAVISSSWQ